MVKTSDFSDTLKKLWEQIRLRSGQEAPFYAYTWHEIWFRTLGTDWTPYILNADNRVVVPFARMSNSIMFSGGKEGTDYIDIIGSGDDIKKYWPEILTFLKKDKVKKLSLFNIPDGSPTVTFFRDKGAAITQEDTTPILNLPSNWKAYLSSLNRKDRHELTRKIRKFEREHKSLSLETVTEPENQIRILLRLMRMDERKRRFLTQQMESFFRDIIIAFRDQVWVMTINENGTETAVFLAFISRTEVLLYNSGYDFAQSPGAGFYLKVKNIEYAIRRNFKTYNFLQGSERYKYELGGKDFPVWKIEAEL